MGYLLPYVTVTIFLLLLPLHLIIYPASYISRSAKTADARPAEHPIFSVPRRRAIDTGSVRPSLCGLGSGGDFYAV